MRNLHSPYTLSVLVGMLHWIWKQHSPWTSAEVHRQMPSATKPQILRFQVSKKNAKQQTHLCSHWQGYFIKNLSFFPSAIKKLKKRTESPCTGLYQNTPKFWFKTYLWKQRCFPQSPWHCHTKHSARSPIRTKHHKSIFYPGCPLDCWGMITLFTQPSCSDMNCFLSLPSCSLSWATLWGS